MTSAVLGGPRWRAWLSLIVPTENLDTHLNRSSHPDCGSSEPEEVSAEHRRSGYVTEVRSIREGGSNPNDMTLPHAGTLKG